MPLECNTDIHNYETRTQHKLCELKTDHEYAKKCLRYDVIKIINNTPALILDKIETQSKWICWIHKTQHAAVLSRNMYNY